MTSSLPRKCSAELSYVGRGGGGGGGGSRRRLSVGRNGGRGSGGCGGADDGTRTRNRRFTKPLLYQLSYVGTHLLNLPMGSARPPGSRLVRPWWSNPEPRFTRGADDGTRPRNRRFTPRLVQRAARGAGLPRRLGRPGREARLRSAPGSDRVGRRVDGVEPSPRGFASGGGRADRRVGAAFAASGGGAAVGLGVGAARASLAAAAGVGSRPHRRPPRRLGGGARGFGPGRRAPSGAGLRAPARRRRRGVGRSPVGAGRGARDRAGRRPRTAGSSRRPRR